MITSTIGDLLDGKLRDLKTGEHGLYVIKANEVTLYVGRSVDPITRLWQHLGRGHLVGATQGNESRLGFFIKLMWPESATWQIELSTPGDVNIEGPEPRRGTGEAERYLIEQLRPCLNSIYNDNPTSLPSHIKRKLFDRYRHIPAPIMPWDEKRGKQS